MAKKSEREREIGTRHYTENYRNKEVGPQGMEQRALDQTLGFAEWQLRSTTRELVNEHAAVIAVRHDGSEVVSLGMPRHLLDLLEML